MSDLPDPRFADIIRTDAAAATAGDIVIIGVPTDEGIKRNGGRVGAAQAPDEIRKYLRKLTPHSGHSSSKSISSLRIFDHGNISGASLEEIHLNAKGAIEDYITRGCFVISLGGGHDVTYPLVNGVRQGLKQDFGLINIDAHLDVREKKNGFHHSGSSFRLLIEENIVNGKDFTEFGIQPFAAAASHIDWVTSQGSTVRYSHDIQAEGVTKAFKTEISRLDKFYLSFDIDSIRASDAPGCSAPSPVGFTAEDAIMMCYESARSGKLISMDIVEVSPPFDIDGRTSRLAARMIAATVAGLSE